jgi:hypothetical protein
MGDKLSPGPPAAKPKSNNPNQNKDDKRREATEKKKKKKASSSKLVSSKKMAKPRSKQITTMPKWKMRGTMKKKKRKTMTTKEETRTKKGKTKKEDEEADLAVAAGTSDRRKPWGTARSQGYTKVDEHRKRVPSTERVTLDERKQKVESCHATVGEPVQRTLSDANEIASYTEQVSDQGQPDIDSDTDNDSDSCFQPKEEGPRERAAETKRPGPRVSDRLSDQVQTDKRASSAPKRTSAGRKQVIESCHATVGEPAQRTLPDANELACYMGQVSDQGQPDSDSDSDGDSDGNGDSDPCLKPKEERPSETAVAAKRPSPRVSDRLSDHVQTDKRTSSAPKRTNAGRKRKPHPTPTLGEAEVSDQGQADSDSDSSCDSKGQISRSSETAETSTDIRSCRIRRDYRRFVKAAREEAQRFADNPSDFDRYDISVLPIRLRQDFPNLAEDFMLEFFNRMLDDPAFVYTLF